MSDVSQETPVGAAQDKLWLPAAGGPCEWFRCDAPAEEPILMGETCIGRLCGRHAVELVETFTLYRLGNEQRRARPPAAPLKVAAAPDPNRCRKCGHPSSAHQLPSYERRVGECIGCGGSACGFEGGWLPPEESDAG